MLQHKRTGYLSLLCNDISDKGDSNQWLKVEIVPCSQTLIPAVSDRPLSRNKPNRLMHFTSIQIDNIHTLYTSLHRY